MGRTHSLSVRLAKIEAGLLIAALLAMGLVLWMSARLDGTAAALNEAGRMRMQTWRLASSVQAGLPASRIEALADEFEASLRLIADGDAARRLSVPWDRQTTRDFREVEQAWPEYEALLLHAGARDADVAGATEAFMSLIERFVSSIEHRMEFLAWILSLCQALMMALAAAGAVILFYVLRHYIVRPFNRLEESVNPLTVQKARFEALYNISVFLAQANTLQEMSRGFSSRARELMKADALVVRWLGDAPGKYLIVGEDRFPLGNLEEEYCLRAGVCACGNPGVESRTKVIPIRQSDIVSLRHCDRLGYQTLMTVPVRARNKTLGEINLFYRREIEFPEEEKELIETLAHHLAGAAESIRLAAMDREAAVSGERTRIARELHDSIAQSLAFLKIQVGLLRNAIARDDRKGVDHTLAELGHGLGECTADVRELLLHFRARAHGDDIEAAIEEVLHKFRQQAGIEASWSIEGDGLPLARDVQIQVLRVLQEALSNVRKHARASHAAVEVRRGTDWTFTVRDDGIGFGAGRGDDSLRVGLKIMRERAGVIGAAVAVESAPGHGTVVRLTVPGAGAPYAAAVSETDMLAS